MIDILTQPEEFKELLKNKWLDYYQANHSWLQQVMNKDGNWRDEAKFTQEELKEFRKLEDEEYHPRRPNSKFILGVVTALEPQLTGLFSYLVKANHDPNSIAKNLGLDFDPEIELKKRTKKLADKNTEIDSNYINQIRKEIDI